jgi:hypothetical protein
MRRILLLMLLILVMIVLFGCAARPRPRVTFPDPCHGQCTHEELCAHQCEGRNFCPRHTSFEDAD